MPFKPRTESKELKTLRMLNKRKDLSLDEKQRYFILKKGYEGEVIFDSFTFNLDSQFFILNDLLLQIHNSTFQIDKLIISQETIIPCDVKYIEGDYFYKDGDFHNKTTGKKINNPLHQLDRCETLLRQFLQKFGFQFYVEGYIVFNHPSFFLYQAPMNDKIIYCPQLNSFLKTIGKKPSRLNERHRKLAELLVREHMRESSFSQLPPYNYDRVRKGVTCSICDSFNLKSSKKKLFCMDCGNEEDIESAVVRNIGELKFLFPDRRITRSNVYDWCRLEEHKRKIRRILIKNYKLIGRGKYAYYEIGD